MVGCCLALTTDCRLYSSHYCQCCLGPLPAGWDACCCRCSVELTGGSTHQLIFQINLLLGHVTLGCAIAFAGGDMDAVHNWSQYTHWTWHCTSSSDLLEYHTTRRYCTSLDVHAMGHVALLTRAVPLDRLKQTWCSTSSDLIECYVMLSLPSALYATGCAHRWTWCCQELCLEGYMSLHSLGEYAPASSVLCTIGLAERTCDVVRRRFSRHCQHCHNVYAVVQLLLSTILVCDWLVLAFHLSVALSVSSSRDLLLMQLHKIDSFYAFISTSRKCWIPRKERYRGKVNML